jgi:hypothetical protein
MENKDGKIMKWMKFIFDKKNFPRVIALLFVLMFVIAVNMNFSWTWTQKCGYKFGWGPAAKVEIKKGDCK